MYHFICLKSPKLPNDPGVASTALWICSIATEAWYSILVYLSQKFGMAWSAAWRWAELAVRMVLISDNHGSDGWTGGDFLSLWIQLKDFWPRGL